MTAASQAAGKQVYDASVDEFARTLSKYRSVLPTLYDNNLVMPDGSDEAAYRKMATDLLEKKKTTLKDRNGNDVVISVDPGDPDNLDARDTKRSSIFKNALGVGNLNTLISRQSVNDLSGAIENAVEQNSSDIGFLKGASFMNALKGLLRWIFVDGFAGGFDGLKKNIATITAEGIHEDVTANLKKLRGEKPGMSTLLTDEAIRKAADGAYFSALEKGGFAAPNAPKKEAFAAIKPFTLPDAQIKGMRDQVRERILHPEGGEDLATLIRNEYAQGVADYKKSHWFKGMFAPKADKINATADKTALLIADVISREATDPDTARKLVDMTPEQYADHMAKAVGEEMRTREKELGFAFAFDDKVEGTDKTYLDTFTDKVHSAVLKNHGQLLVPTGIAASGKGTDATLENALSAAEGAKRAGFGNMQHADEIRAQPGGKIGAERIV